MSYDIEGAIPHRPPFLFVDEVVSVGDGKIHARRRFGDEAFYQGHYPDAPITPGVILCEAIFQTGALLVSLGGADIPEGAVPVLTRIKGAKFKRAVMPGETVDLEVSLTDQLGAAYVFKGKASVEGKAAVTIDYACALTAPPGQDS